MNQISGRAAESPVPAPEISKATLNREAHSSSGFSKAVYLSHSKYVPAA